MALFWRISPIAFVFGGILVAIDILPGFSSLQYFGIVLIALGGIGFICTRLGYRGPTSRDPGHSCLRKSLLISP